MLTMVIEAEPGEIDIMMNHLVQEDLDGAENRER